MKISELSSGVATQKFGGSKMFDFRRITLFCLKKRLSKHKMTIFFKILGGHGPPGYAYVLKRHSLGLLFKNLLFQRASLYQKF